MTSRKSSGSSRVESAVEPTRSQNITVIWRRSAEVGMRAAEGGEGAAAAGAALLAPAAPPSLAPHCAQKREPAALAWPQAAQLSACGVPHCGQKRLSPAMLLPQLEQVLASVIDKIPSGNPTYGLSVLTNSQHVGRFRHVSAWHHHTLVVC